MQAIALSELCMISLRHVVGGAIIAGANCLSLGDAVRVRESNSASTSGNKSNQGKKDVKLRDDEENEGKGKRKNPGYLKRKRNPQKVTANPADDKGGKAARLLPRLAQVCKQVRASAERLARCRGVRESVKLSTIAAVPVADNTRCKFGAGLRGDDDDDGESIGCDDEDDEADKQEDIAE